MPLGLKALSIKSAAPIDPAQVNAQLLKAHATFITNVQKRMIPYPAQKPTKSGYKRTGDYGRGWSGPGAVKISASESSLVNRNGHAVWVGGPTDQAPGQAKEMQRRGWVSVTTVAHEEISKVRGLYIEAIKGRP